jgi:hypothetical protein
MSSEVTVTIEVDGGLAALPGLARPFTVSAADLPPDDARQLGRLVAESRFFELPQQRGSARPDARSYTITVKADGRSRTLTLSDPLPNAALRQLVQLVERRRRAR